MVNIYQHLSTINTIRQLDAFCKDGDTQTGVARVDLPVHENLLSTNVSSPRNARTDKPANWGRVFKQPPRAARVEVWDSLTGSSETGGVEVLVY